MDDHTGVCLPDTDRHPQRRLTETAADSGRYNPDHDIIDTAIANGVKDFKLSSICVTVKGCYV